MTIGGTLAVLFWHLYYIRWLIGYFQQAVVVGFQHIKHVAFAAFLCQLAAAGQCFVFGVLQFFLEFVNLYEVLLAAVTVRDVDDEECRDEQYDPYLTPDGLRGENVTAQYFAECEVLRLRSLVFGGRFLDSFPQR